MSEHTPGPWKVDIRSGCAAVYPANQDHNCLIGASEWACAYIAGNDVTAQPYGWHPLSEEQIANARLIAAAPDLLAACKRVIDQTDIDGWIGDCVAIKSQLYDAVAKAEGR